MRWQRVRRILLDQGRGIVGALIFGTPLLFTMETWWLGWRLPAWLILSYAVVGLAVVLVVVRSVGFRKEEEQHGSRGHPFRTALDFMELTLQSFASAYVVLLLLGVLEIGDDLATVARLGLVQVVPLGFGAAIANRLLSMSGKDGASERPFPQDLAVFALGALFFVFPIAPTEEMELIAAHAGWERLGLIVVASLLLTHLTLYEIEFRGQRGRLVGLTLPLRWGETALVYATAFAVSAFILAGFGHFVDTPHQIWMQESIVLAFPAALGGSAARVIL